MKVSLIKYFFTPAPGIVCVVNTGISEQNSSAAILCYRNQMGQFLRTNPPSPSSSSICKLFPFKPLNDLLGLFCTLWFWVPLEASKWEHELFTYFKIGKMGETTKRLVSSWERDEISHCSYWNHFTYPSPFLSLPHLWNHFTYPRPFLSLPHLSPTNMICPFTL